MKKIGEKILNKKLARLMAMFLVCSMIFTSNSFLTLAEGIENHNAETTVENIIDDSSETTIESYYEPEAKTKDYDEEPEVDPTKAGADTIRPNDDTIDNSRDEAYEPAENSSDTISSIAENDEPIKDSGDIEKQSDIFISAPIDTSTLPVENTDSTITKENEENNEENKTEEETINTESKSSNDNETTNTEQENTNESTIANSTIAESKKNLELVATISEMEEVDIDIATDSEMDAINADIATDSDIEPVVYGDSNEYILPKDWLKTYKDLNIDTSNTNHIEGITISKYPTAAPTGYKYNPEIPESNGLKLYVVNTHGQYYKVTIYAPSNLEIYAPEDSSYLFSANLQYSQGGFNLVTQKNLIGLNLINTSRVKNMSHMFDYMNTIYTFDLSSWDTDNVTDMSYMFRDCTFLKELKLSSKNVTNMSYMFSQTANSFSNIDLSSLDTSKVTNMSHMFERSYAKKLDLTCFDTSSVTDMSYMFYGCGFFEDLKISSWDTSKVTNMRSMFSDFGHLGTIASIDFGSWDTGNVTDMCSMFYGSNKLTSLDLSNFELDKVTTMMNMFQNCQALETLNLSNLNASEVTDMSYMFASCISLKTLNLSGFKTNSVTNTKGMFGNCRSLETLDLSNFNTSKVTDMSYMFQGGRSLKSINLSSFNTSSVTSMQQMFTNCNSLTSIDLSGFDTSKATNMQSMFENCSSLETLDVSNFDTKKAASIGLYKLFGGCSSLKSINVTNLLALETQNISNLFEGCSGLTSLDLTSFDTSKVKYMNAMFKDCSSLATIYVSDRFITDNVTGSTDMFSGCTVLVGEAGTTYTDSNPKDKTYARYDKGVYSPGYFSHMPFMYWYTTDTDATLHLGSTNVTGSNVIQFGTNGISYSGLDKDKITKVVFDDDIVATTTQGMFNQFSNLTDIEGIDKLDTTNVTNMSCMFYGCSALNSLDLSSFDTSKVTNMNGIFYQCENITSINLSNFDTSNVTDMSNMFYLCKKLPSINVTNFDTSNVTTMEGMFSGCNTLTSLKLTNFDTNKVTSMSLMFEACTSLTTIKASENFVTTNVTGIYSTDMFNGCTNLVGGQGTVYDSSKVDKTYAHLDEGNTNPGYFTALQVTGITISSPSSISNYVAGDSFNGSGLVLTVTYDDLSTAEISYDSNPTAFAFTPDPLTASDTQVTITYSGKTTTQNVTVVPKAVTEILEVTGFPGQSPTEPSFVKEGDPIVITSVTIKVKYNNGQEETISYDPANPQFSLLPNTTATTGVIYKVKVGEVEKELDENIIYVYKTDDSKIMNTITNPTKTIYIEGEYFDPTGISVNVTGFDGNTEDIAYNNTTETNFYFTPAKTNPLTADTTEIKVQYGNYPNCSKPVNIKVLKRAQTITISSGTVKDYYNDNDTFDTTCINNLKITVTNQDNTTETITYADHPEYFTFEPALGTNLTPTNDKITIKYAGATLDLPIVVEPSSNPNSISQQTPPTKTNYIAGEPFDPTGLVITATYPGGITLQIPYNDDTKANFTFDPDITTGTLSFGDETVKVTYKGTDTTIPVTVRKQITEITEIVTPPTYIEYSKGDKFDPTGLVIKVKYNDNSTEDIPYDNAHKDLFTFTPDLTHTFDATDVGNKVKVSVGGVIAKEISAMQPIYDDSVSIVYSDPTTGETIIKHNITQTEFEQFIEEAISQGATGFHEYDANGIKDAKDKYNKYTPTTMTKDEAIAKFTTTGLTKTIFIGATYNVPAPAPSPSGSDSGGGNGGGGISYDANGNIQPGLPNQIQPQQEPLNTTNTIPQTNLISDNNLINNLQTYQENKTAQYINARDDSGHTGFGKWQHIPNTTTWYFLSGDFNNTINQTTQTINKGTAGLLCNGWYNLGWKGRDEWYHFDNKGVMQMGWFTENNKIYYLETDISSNWYGRMVTGQYNINGTTYNFDQSGALVQ